FRNILQVLASGSRTAAIGSGANRVERHFLPSPAENWRSTAPSGSENRVAITTVTHNIRRARGVDTHRGPGSPCTVRAPSTRATWIDRRARSAGSTLRKRHDLEPLSLEAREAVRGVDGAGRKVRVVTRS